MPHNLNQRNRVVSIDVLRGLVIVLMALDHLRDMWALEPFQPEDLSQTTVTYFFTRWVTHFCAPVFVFLAGTSVFLYEQKLKDKAALSIFLLKRGFWLILVEIFIINWAWSWTMFWNQWGFFLQVIWVIGIAMVLMAGFIWLSTRLVLVLSLMLIVGHNALDGIEPKAFGSLDWIWTFLHARGWIGLVEDNSFGIYIVYPMIPWIGVMGIGYVFGEVMTWQPHNRKRFLLRTGLISMAFFFLLRGFNIYGDPSDWETQQTGAKAIISFLNTQKYPPSLLFLLMTLGPALLLLIAFENTQSRLTDILRVFGRVPFFFYILHLIIPHALSLIYFKLTTGHWFDLANAGSPKNWPEYYEPSIMRLYIVWLLTVIGLYFPCRWFDTYKSTKPHHWWLKYL